VILDARAEMPIELPMPLTHAQLCAGSPRFTDPSVQRTARDQGIPAAWAQALTKGAHHAAAEVDGDFAVGLRMSSGRTFLAVDRFSIRSLCYRLDGDILRFAERADALADPGHELDPQALFDYLYFHVIASPRTVFKGIRRLPPAHYALFDHGQLTVAPYWKPTFDETCSSDFSALRQEFRQLLKQAVERQMDGSKPACFLSGGTDSSTVAGMVREAGGKPPATYSIGFGAAGYDEMDFARIASQHFGTEHHEYYVTPDDLVRSIAPVARHYDQPFGNSSALPAYYCAMMARDDGVSHILAGDGGDELFGGNARYAMQRVFGAYAKLPVALRKGLIEPALLRTPLGRAPLLRKGAGYVKHAMTTLPDRLENYNLLRRLGIDEVLTPDFLSWIDVGSPLRQQREVWAAAAGPSELNQTLAYDWRYTLAENDLPKVSLMTQLAGLSVAYPMLDNALVDFSLRLPVHYKLRGLKLRWFFKEALRDFLPDSIIRKKKHGFGLPFGVWMAGHDGLRLLARESLASLGTRGIIRSEFIRTLLEQRLNEHPAYYGEMAWILIMLEQWLQAHAPSLRF
jgi:asparagine synthase (glutamine-hydrolysing)